MTKSHEDTCIDSRIPLCRLRGEHPRRVHNVAKDSRACRNPTSHVPRPLSTLDHVTHHTPTVSRPTHRPVPSRTLKQIGSDFKLFDIASPTATATSIPLPPPPPPPPPRLHYPHPLNADHHSTLQTCKHVDGAIIGITTAPVAWRIANPTVISDRPSQ